MDDIDYQRAHIDEEIAMFESLISEEYDSIDRIQDRIKRYKLDLSALRFYKCVALSAAVRGTSDV